MHTRLTTDTAHFGVYAMKDTEGHRVWVGEVSHPLDDPDGVIMEERWDAFTHLMFAHGVEPATLDPATAAVVAGVVTERYRLREILEAGE